MSEANQYNQAKPSTTDFTGQNPGQRPAPSTSPKAGRDPVQPNNRGKQGNK